MIWQTRKKAHVIDDGTFVWGKTGKTEKLIREPFYLAGVENPAMVNLVIIKVCVNTILSQKDIAQCSSILPEQNLHIILYYQL